MQRSYLSIFRSLTSHNRQQRGSGDIDEKDGVDAVSNSVPKLIDEPRRMLLYGNAFSVEKAISTGFKSEL